jgi:hypothetical protein
MSEELIVLPIEEQISQELVKANVTEAIIADLKERLLPLKIAGIEDKETYLIVQAGRKECKALRVAAKKICTNGREQAVAISKAWIAKEKEVTGRISEVEDYLEKQEVEYEAEVAKEKEARKRKQEEQFIMRQQELSAMGVLYADGSFSIGEVSFEFSLVKESEEDIWKETILPKFKAEYEKTQAEQIEKDRLKTEAEAELKRQQEELEQKQKELLEKEAALKREAERQAAEAKAKEEAKNKSRLSQLISIGLKPSVENEHLYYIGYDCAISHLDITGYDDDKWDKMIHDVTGQIKRKKEEEAEEKVKEQERKDLQNKRYAALFPFREYGEPVEMDSLWSLSEEVYNDMLGEKTALFHKAEEDKAKRIADDAAKKERERIEEEQRQAESKRVNELGEFRMKILKSYNGGDDSTIEDLGKMNDTTWEIIRAGWQDSFEALVKKQEEEKKAEELLQATEKEKWFSMMAYLEGMIIHPMRSSQYRKKVAILKEKLEEIKAL